jgi:hypothetical protein
MKARVLGNAEARSVRDGLVISGGPVTTYRRRKPMLRSHRISHLRQTTTALIPPSRSSTYCGSRLPERLRTKRGLPAPDAALFLSGVVSDLDRVSVPRMAVPRVLPSMLLTVSASAGLRISWPRAYPAKSLCMLCNRCQRRASRPGDTQPHRHSDYRTSRRFRLTPSSEGDAESSMSPWAQPAPLSPHKHLREDRGSIAVEEFYDVEELQQIETALSLLV